MLEKLVKLSVLLFGLCFFIAQCPWSFAQDEDPSLLELQLKKLNQEGNYKQAIPIAEKLLAIREKKLGPENPDTAQSLNNLAFLYDQLGDYAKAEPLYQQTLQIFKKMLGPEHLNTAQILDNLAGLYDRMGAYAKAEPLYQQALEIRQKVLGPEHPITAANLNNLAVLYYEMGAYAKAEALYQQALQIRQNVLGPEHPLTATTLNNLAELYQARGDYAKAEPLLRQVLQIRQKVLGPEHPDTAGSLNNLALLYDQLGDYAKAEALYQQALQIFKKVLGPEHPLTVTTLNNLVFVYETMGDYAQAEPLLRQVLQIRQKVLGPEHPDTATSLNNLAELYHARGDYAKAEALYQQALQIFKKVLGPEHPKTATILDNLAVFYEDMGAYAKAEPLLQQVLQIRQKVLGPEHPDTAMALGNLGLLYAHIGDLAKVEPLFQQALQIFKKVFGPEHPATVTSLNNLAELYDHMGAYAKAEPLLQQVLQIRQKVLGPEHPDTALSLNNLALLYYEMGDYAKAEPLLQQVLEIRQKVLGPEHPSTAASLENLALVKIDVGQIVEAKSLAQLSAKAHLASLSNILSFASEQQRLAFEDTIHPYALFPILKGSEVDLASAVLRYKGVVLDSIIEDRLVAEASKQSEDRNLVGRLASDKRQLGRLLLQTPNKPSGESKKKIEDLEQEVDEIQERLARHVSGLGQARRALSVTLEQVQTTIPKDGVLIEYLRYGHYLGKGKWEQRYGAIALASSGQPSWIPLGDAPEIEAQVQRYRDIIEKLAQWSGNQEELSFSEQKLSKNLQKLYAELWQPIEETQPSEIKRVIISPDGQLNFVSFATLLKPDKHFVAEKYLIQYVASGRDLVREVRPPSSSQVFVFANPEFNSFPSTLVADADPAPSASELGAKKDPAPSAFVPEGSRGIELRDMVDMRFDPLEGTQEESDELCKKFKQWQWDSKTFDREIATKAELLKVQSPYILHLATHGFFAPEDEGSEAGLEKQAFSSVDRNLAKAKFFKNPMHRSGLALTGANVTLRAWRDGKPLPLENDGILTAEDVSTLDLRGTWLVTLSACDTGSGEAKAGEGVMGLRRGFIQAGAENLLMTLWSINDTMTVEIMSDFYEAAHESGNAPQALAEVQRNWLVKLRKEKGLARAVSIAGPFIMSSQGKP